VPTIPYLEQGDGTAHVDTVIQQWLLHRLSHGLEAGEVHNGRKVVLFGKRHGDPVEPVSKAIGIPSNMDLHHIVVLGDTNLFEDLSQSRFVQNIRLVERYIPRNQLSHTRDALRLHGRTC